METLSWALVLISFTILWGFISANRVFFKQINLKIKDWPQENTRILFLSDLHTSGRGLRIKRTISLAKNTPADLVCITGDLIVRRIYQEEKVAQALKKITAGRPTFLVWGNNDYNREIDRQHLYTLLEKQGIKVLVNESVTFENLVIGGLGDPFWHKDDLKKTLSVDVDLLLSHTPEPILNVAGKVKLLLAGHTHAGQFCWPDGSPLLPELKKEKAFAYGLQFYKGTFIYTTSGIGTTRLPLRYFCYPELVLLEVTPE